MLDNYAMLVQKNLDRLYAHLPEDLANNLPGKRDGSRFVFTAFGEQCVIEPKRITLGETQHSSVFGILISLYALHACSDICVPTPFKSFNTDFREAFLINARKGSPYAIPGVTYCFKI